MSSFHLRAKRYLITLKTHIDRNELKAMYELLGQVNVCIVAHEFGTNNDEEEHPYEHTHVAIEFSKALSVQNKGAQHYFCVGKAQTKCGMIHANIAPVGRTDKDWFTVLRYIVKEDKSNLEEVNKILLDKKQVSLLELVAASPSKTAFIGELTNYRDVAGASLAYDILHEDDQSSEGSIDILDQRWQKYMFHILQTNPPHKRHIHWIIGKKGGEGKSTLCSVLEDHGWLCLGTAKKADDMANIIGKAYTKKDKQGKRAWDGKGLAIDLPRGAEENAKSLYDFLEMLKNKKITCGKYEGCNIRTKHRPKLLVFANWYPNVTKCSLDRWQIFSIRDENIFQIKAKTIKKWSRGGAASAEQSSSEEGVETDYIPVDVSTLPESVIVPITSQVDELKLKLHMSEATNVAMQRQIDELYNKLNSVLALAELKNQLPLDSPDEEELLN